MLTLFLVFIITKGALTLYEGNTIGSGAARGGGTAQFVIGNLSMHPVIKLSNNWNNNDNKFACTSASY